MDYSSRFLFYISLFRLFFTFEYHIFFSYSPLSLASEGFSNQVLRASDFGPVSTRYVIH